MGGACGEGGADGGPGGSCGPIWATCASCFIVTVGSGGNGGAPTWNRLRRPPSMFTACPLAKRSRRKVWAIDMGSTRSAGRFGFIDGRNSSLDRDDVAVRRGAAWASDDGAATGGTIAGAGLGRAAAGLGRLGSGLEGPDSTLL